jgi:hypothetical protein
MHCVPLFHDAELILALHELSRGIGRLGVDLAAPNAVRLCIVVVGDAEMPVNQGPLELGPAATRSLRVFHLHLPRCSIISA